MNMTLEKQPSPQEKDLPLLSPAEQIEVLSEKHNLTPEEQITFVQMAADVALNGVENAVSGKKIGVNLSSALEEFAAIGKNEAGVENELVKEKTQQNEYKAPETETKESHRQKIEGIFRSTFGLNSELDMNDKIAKYQAQSALIRLIVTDIEGLTPDDERSRSEQLTEVLRSVREAVQMIPQDQASGFEDTYADICILTSQYIKENKEYFDAMKLEDTAHEFSSFG